MYASKTYNCDAEDLFAELSEAEVKRYILAQPYMR